MPLIASGVEVNLPKFTDSETKKDSKHVVIKIGKNNYFISAGESDNLSVETEIDSVVKRYKELSKRYPDIAVNVEGSRHIDYSRVVEVISALQDAGATNIKITMPDKSN